MSVKRNKTAADVGKRVEKSCDFDWCTKKQKTWAKRSELQTLMYWKVAFSELEAPRPIETLRSIANRKRQIIEKHKSGKNKYFSIRSVGLY